VYKSFRPDAGELTSEEITEEAQKLMHRIDANEDGMIDYDEFVGYFEQKYQ